ncbi:TPA: acid phosphatase AphA [Klebsiella oxytoca]|uniref:Class B acid phosphatase n=1 Tax=Klebsiella oxytoca TaxID=571 RepID=A0AAN5RCC3_KLEOX|nr:acid phosphatase AphA [Klebsiella oxytoca]
MRFNALKPVAAMLFITLSHTVIAAGPAGATLEQLTHQYAVHWVSVQQLKDKFSGEKPMNVGFDIDDTLLYSSPAFFYGKNKFSPGSMDFLKNKKFWDEISSDGWDKFSVPKQSGRDLINLHLERGDNIYFITGRPMPSDGKEDLTEILRKDFSIPPENLNKVIYSGVKKNAKVEYIRAHHISVFYGDSDSDILDARKGGATGIRVLRPLLSTNTPFPVNGGLGEDVVVNSQY